VVTELRSRKPNLAPFLGNSRLLELSDTTLIVGVQGGFHASQVEKQANLDFIEQTAGEILGRKIHLKVQPLAGAPKPDTKTKSPGKNKPDAQDPAIQDVLKVFPQGEVIEHDKPGE
jgi:hypothetical protein